MERLLEGGAPFVKVALKYPLLYIRFQANSKDIMRILSLIVLGFVATTSAQDSSDLRINQIQVIGTHNSYHAGFSPSEALLWQAKNPKLFRALDYRHPRLEAQLDAGIGQVEIDVFADPDGGRFAHPASVEMVKARGSPWIRPTIPSTKWTSQASR